MKKTFIIAVAVLAYAFSLTAQVKTTPFEYPVVPDSLQTLQQRTSFLVSRFWDNADMKKVMADTASFNKAFEDFVSFIPYAHADTVKHAINNLTLRFKEDPKNLLKLAYAAEKEMFGPEAQFWADEQYMQFTRPVFTNKKISADDKKHFLDNVKMLNGSQVGSTVSPIPYTTQYGAQHSLHDQKAEYYLLYFYGPECSDCDMTHLRMETDVALENITKSGQLKIIDIYVGEPTDAWKKSIASFPYEWEAGYSETAGNSIDLRELPRMYLLDNEYKIIARNLNINQVLSLASALNRRNDQQQ